MTLHGRKLKATLLAPTNAAFTELPAAPLEMTPHPARQNPNRGIRKLAVHLPDARDTRIAVLLEPVSDGTKARVNAKMVPLTDW